MQLVSPQPLESAQMVVRERPDDVPIYCARLKQDVLPAYALTEVLDRDVKNMNATCGKCGGRCSN